MDQASSELNPSILSNPEARHAYYEQRRQNTAAREQQQKRSHLVQTLAEVTQFEIERQTKEKLTPDEFNALRDRISKVVERLEVRG